MATRSVVYKAGLLPKLVHMVSACHTDCTWSVLATHGCAHAHKADKRGQNNEQELIWAFKNLNAGHQGT